MLAGFTFETQFCQCVYRKSTLSEYIFVVESWRMNVRREIVRQMEFEIVLWCFTKLE